MSAIPSAQLANVAAIIKALQQIQPHPQPVLPYGAVADPYGNYAFGKDQARVPQTQLPVLPPPKF